MITAENAPELMWRAALMEIAASDHWHASLVWNGWWQLIITLGSPEPEARGLTRRVLDYVRRLPATLRRKP